MGVLGEQLELQHRPEETTECKELGAAPGAKLMLTGSILLVLH